MDHQESEEPKPKTQRWKRALIIVSAAAGVLILAAGGGGYLLYLHYNGQIAHVSIRLPTATQSSSASPTPGSVAATVTADGSENFLLMGSDSRDFSGGQAYNVAPGSPAYVTGQRSDVVILLHVPADGANATVISFPRDSWVQIPGYTDSAGATHAAGYAKLNAAFSLGGAPLLVSTVENLTGLYIDHFVSVNFAGFEGMVNALGGVNVCIGTTRHDPNSGDFLTAGDHHINGTQALAFVRDRESFADQDLGRIKDQEYLLSVLLHKVLSAGTLTNPLKLNDFLNVATKSLTVDNDFSLNDMRALASRFAHLGSADLTFETVPIADANYQATSALYGDQPQSAVKLDSVAAARLFASLAPGASASAPALSGPASSASASASASAAPSVPPPSPTNSLNCAP